jgi:hypothetical protein
LLQLIFHVKIAVVTVLEDEQCLVQEAIMDLLLEQLVVGMFLIVVLDVM